MNKYWMAVAVCAGLALPGVAAARDVSLVGTWKLDNQATLDGIGKSRSKSPEEQDALNQLYQGTTTCTFTETTWSCQSAGNPNRGDWLNRGSYRLLRGDGTYKVVEFDVTQQKPKSDEPVQHGVALIKISGDRYAIFRPELDYWQYLRRK